MIFERKLEGLGWGARLLLGLRIAVVMTSLGIFLHVMRWEVLAGAETFALWLLIALQATLLLVCVAALGRWLLAFVAWIFGVEFFRAMSSMKVKYLATPIDASDLRQFDPASIFQTLVNYPAIVVWVIAGLSAVAVAVWAVGRVGPPVSQRWRMALITATIPMIIVQYQVRREIAPRPDMMNSTSISAFAQSFFLDEADLSVADMPRVPAEITCPKRPTNIVMVLEESTFKTATAASSDDPVLKSFFRGNIFSGPLHVHVFGGKTHLSDFAFLVGVPHLAMKGANEYLTRTLAGRIRLSFPQILHQCGYESTVIYPIGRAYFNSYSWFRSVGFDHVIAPDELGFAGDDRWRIQDGRFFDEALKIAQSARKPQLIYVPTIAQHGPHDRDGNAEVEYQRRLLASASAFNGFENSLAKIKGAAPWLLGWFGDHRPFRVEEADQVNRYTTWATLRWVGIKPVHLPTESPESADIAFLARLIQRNVGVESGYMSDATDGLISACPQNYFDCPAGLRKRHQEALRASGAVLMPQR